MDACRKLSLPEGSLRLVRKRTLTDIYEHSEELDKGESEESRMNATDPDNQTESPVDTKESNLPQMHQVILDGNVELLKELIKSGADINVLDSTGWPPIHTAIRAGRTECAALLIKEGAGDFYFNKQKQEYLKRLQRCQKVGVGRKLSYWM